MSSTSFASRQRSRQHSLYRQIVSRRAAARLAGIATAFVVATLSAAVAQAACNLIPVADIRFASTLGGVETPVTAPGKFIRLSIDPVCDSSPGFVPAPFINAVTITFLPPSGALPIDVGLPPFLSIAEDCDLPGARCRTLRILAAVDTTIAFPPYGLAGPARLTVTDDPNAGGTGETLAVIDELFLPSSDCDRTPEPLLEHFTFLPVANSFADLESGAAIEILATVDGGGNLLVPFDYWGGGSKSVLAENPGSPIAVFLEGTAEIPAQGAGDTKSISEVIAAQERPFSLIRSFTLDGRPLPPLLRITETGQLFGSADAEESFLRIQRTPAGGEPLYDLSDRLANGVGPIVIDTFSVSVGNPIPLTGLSASDTTVGYVRDEIREATNLNPDPDMLDKVAQVVDSDVGNVLNTGMAVTELPNGPFTGAELKASGDMVAFLQPEIGENTPSAFGTDFNSDGDVRDNMIRVFTGDGVESTSATELEAAILPLVDDRAVTISGSRVFFRTPAEFADEIRVVDDELISPEDVVVSPDGAHVYVVENTLDSVIVFSRDPVTGLLEPNQVPVEPPDFFFPAGITISPDGAHVYALGTGGDVIHSFSRSLPDGSLTLVDSDLWDGAGGDIPNMLTPTQVEVSPDGAHVYVSARNSDALVVFSRDASTGELTFVENQVDGVGGVTGLAGAEDVIVSADGLHVYACSLFGSSLVHFERDVTTGQLTFVQSILVQVEGFDAFLERLVLSPDGRHVYVTAGAVIVFELDPTTGSPSLVQQLEDPTGDEFGIMFAHAVTISPDGSRVLIGSDNDARLAIFRRDLGTGKLTHVGTLFDEVAGVDGLFSVEGIAFSPDGRHFYTAAVDEFGIFRNESMLTVLDGPGGTMLDGQAGATDVAVAAERAAILTPELASGTDLNSDGDTIDEGAQIVDASGSKATVKNLNIAASRVAISDEIVVLTVPERAQAGLDRNADGDTIDAVLAVGQANSKSVTNVAVAADAIAASGTKAVFTTPEAQEGPAGIGCTPVGAPAACELNGDGDALDRVIRIYDQADDEIIETGFAAEEFVMNDTYVAFRTDEAAQGDSPLNGDGLADELVMHVAVLETGEVIPTGRAALTCFLPGCSRDVPYKLQGHTLSFLTDEAEQQDDLNGDLDQIDIVLTVFNIRSRTVETVATVVEGGAEPNTPEESPLPENNGAGTIVTVEGKESDFGKDFNGDGIISDDIVVAIAGDLDEDGSFDGTDSCVSGFNPDQLDIDNDGLGDTACDLDSTLCPATPLGDCSGSILAGGSALSFKNSDEDKKKKLSWKVNKGQATDIAELGDPVNGVAHYSFCVYEAGGGGAPSLTAAIVPGRVCGKKPCWKGNNKGVRFKDKLAFPNGVTNLKLRSGVDGKAKVQLKGKGGGLELPTAALALPVTAQIIVNDGELQQCWSATFSESRKNEDGLFNAKSD